MGHKLTWNKYRFLTEKVTSPNEFILGQESLSLHILTCFVWNKQYNRIVLVYMTGME